MAAPSKLMFTLFPQLPFELRSAIWWHTVLPRVIHLRYKDLSNNHNNTASGFCSPVDLPVALSVCQESRKLLLGSYPLSFGSVFYPPKVRINFSIDTVYLDQERSNNLISIFFNTLNAREMSQLRYLAVEKDLLKVINIPLKCGSHMLPKLEELTVVFDLPKVVSTIHGNSNAEMKLYDRLPDQLVGTPIAHISEFLTTEVWEDDDDKMWDSSKTRPMFGWRKCACETILESDDSDDDDDDEEDDDDLFWGDEMDDDDEDAISLLI
ncbi:hypothetical protein G7Y89_g10491 [Cudoniella acicularis]|uniref:2EXR domain-containing protein n=1 Tax=Cudoniella acicularis TaxID=354080 RepID=A0A8H4RE77_9HELO|nr:hypothetical protein G7Y89_g10491 [Cudoniella acicularis]